ncbi:GNAT family N-acetyltransferase [Saccharopolyspora sp. CA-218241]|uniref:GNAT family N-acetyltransferase n=1 Tax=Saccharopolyspora sp. CA-218241 TaxID=3240027 RepID=UPI003D961B0E
MDERIERHAFHAWPAPVTRRVGGWWVRHTPGVRRLRSGNAALPGDGPAPLAEVEEFYRERGLPTAVQVSPAARHRALDAHLEARGYRREVPVHVLTAATGTVARAEPGWAVDVEAGPTARWQEAFVELDGEDDAREVAEEVVAAIRLPAARTSVTAGDRVLGIGLVVGGDDRWAGIYCMTTRPEHRGRGVAAAILRAGARWAAEHGIPGLYLQVAESNAAARSLYARAGFDHAYGYHYRLR